MKSRYSRFPWVLALAGAAIFAPVASARKPKAPPAAPKDQIEVVGHLPLTDGPVTNFFVTQHYSSYYLYAEHASGKSATLVDVTRSDHPAVLADVAFAPNSGSGNLTLVAGTAALVSSAGPAAATSAAPQSIRIMDFSDPHNPKVAREFNGVTAMTRDDRRGLIFIANGEGIWILRQHLAQDPEVEKAYANYVLYSH